MFLKKFFNIKEASRTEYIVCAILSVIFLAVAVFFCWLTVKDYLFVDLDSIASDTLVVSDNDTIDV